MQRILNYEILRKIGEGGMGQVFLGKNEAIGQMVAIKMLHPRYADNPALRDRFRKEAMMLSGLNHPNIVQFLNFVENEEGVFLIMEYVEGIPLDEFIHKKNGLIVEQRAYPMVCELLDAFEYAHSRGIVHRDIKPGNILIDSGGHVKVLDFGIAQIMSDAGAADKPSDVASGGGSTMYMSPEQVLSRQLDSRSDIYSLGVVIHEMLTGKTPYDRKKLSSMEVKNLIVKAPLPRMKERYEYISDAWQNVVDRMTAKDPDRRCVNCVEARRLIDRELHPKKSNAWIVWLSAAVALLVVAGGFFAWDYTRTKTKYFSDAENLAGVPAGIDRISAKDAKKLDCSYKMEYSHGKLRNMERRNADGEAMMPKSPKDSTDNYASATFLYHDNGKLRQKTTYDADGEMLYEFSYDKEGKQTDAECYKRPENLTQPKDSTAKAAPAPAKAPAAKEAKGSKRDAPNPYVSPNSSKKDSKESPMNPHEPRMTKKQNSSVLSPKNMENQGNMANEK